MGRIVVSMGALSREREGEPLVRRQCGAAVDLIGHRLLPVRHMDLK